MPETGFEDIRPYRDDEVAAVLNRLLNDNEFLDVIARFRLGWLHNLLPGFTRGLVKGRLRGKFAAYHSIASLQDSVEEYLDHALQTSADEVTCSGLENLEQDSPHLFLCNHRDIVLDPALCNVFLHRSGRDTFRIAIGDNLLKRPYSSDLMRLNKSFIVKRGIESRRDKLMELKRLSAYIRQSLTVDGQSVWIAHREGRSKNGWDKTDTAMLKMLNLSGIKEKGLAENSRQLRIVPTAVSYEWDPCDRMKATELAAIAGSRNFEKSEFADVDSMATSILEKKGNIHVAFGTVLSQDFNSAEEMAVEIDRQIVSMYRQHPSNLAAFFRLEGYIPTPWLLSDTQRDIALQELDRRMLGLHADEAEQLLNAYANPVRNFLEKMAAA